MNLPQRKVNIRSWELFNSVVAGAGKELTAVEILTRYESAERAWGILSGLPVEESERW